MPYTALSSSTTNGFVENIGGTGGNTNFTVTSTSNETFHTIDYGYPQKEWWIGNVDSFENHTHAFSQPVAGISLTFNAVTPGEYLSFRLDGVLFDLDTAIASGDASFTGANAGVTVNGTTDKIGTTLETRANLSTLIINVPFTTLEIVSTGAGGNGMVYELSVETDPVVITCFASGTLIKTQSGERPIEDLTAGDLVLTMDHGYQPIRWIGSSKRPTTGDMAPILIRKGALGNDRDLRVSPQHRMLLQGWQAELLYGELEVLATAKSLINDHTIIRVEGGEVEYFHMLFDTHEIVYAEGTPSESFHPGEEGWKGLDQATRDEILNLFPQLAEGDFEAYGPSARISLKHKEGQVLGQYMTKTTKDVLNNA